MKKYISIGIIIILFCAFAIFIYCKNTYTPVLNLINPVSIQVDMNNNGIINDNETFCIPDLESFSLEQKEHAPDFAKEYNLSVKDIISLGYMADNYASGLLISKPVKVKLTGNKTPECRFAEIYINDEKYSDLLVKSGYAARNGDYSKEKFQENIKLAQNLKLAIYNIKSGKYHTTDCKYGLLSSDYSIIPEGQLPKDATPCKFCHVERKSPKAAKSHANIVTQQKLQISNGDIKLILQDFTQKLKPDRDCDTVSCLALLDEINNAKNSIDIAVYGMDVIPKIYNALQNAKQRDVKIRIVYDKSSSSETDYYTETEKILLLADEYNSDYIADKPAYTNKLMHNKFLIFDNKKVLTGSMNISATGLSDYNANAVVIINSEDIAKLYTAEFEQMLSGKFHELKVKPDLPDKFMLGDTKISVYFSPYDKISEKIIPHIANAREYIYIPAFLITHKGLADALMQAKQKNVDVKIIIDANSVTTRNTKHEQLRRSNIPLKTENYAGKMHSKSIIIDDKYIITGSMNFSNSGETKNDENILIIENPEFAKEYKSYFMYLWTKIPDIYLTRNAKAEGKDSIGSCYDGIDNDFDGYIDGNDPGCKFQ